MAHYQKVLVSLDSSSLAERTIPYARAIAARKGSEVILFTVATSGIRFDRPLESYLDNIAKDLKMQGITASPVIAYGDTADQIIDFADANKTDLIIMSTHGHAGIKRWVLGSIAQKVLQGTNIPVLLVKSKAPEIPLVEFRKVLLPLDGSAFAEIAISHVKELAEGSETEVVLLQVTEPPPPIADAPPGWADGVPLNWADYADKLIAQMRGQALQYLEKVKTTFEDKGIKIRSHVAVGKATEKIMHVAQGENVDLIVMGTHGRSGISRWVHGSVASGIEAESLQPLLLIRPGPPESPEI